MLQQTRVETVIPYFNRWMKQFPNIKILAESSENEVLTLWEGLGYYRRAHNLLKTARIIQTQFGGKFPRDLDSLRALPGLGSYSSAAVASIAYNDDFPVIDGNIRRVYSRLFDIKASLNTTVFERNIQKIAFKNLPHGTAGDFNQALMDFGAIICLPKQPKCYSCPLDDMCLAFRRGVQTLRPRVIRAKPVPHELHGAAIILAKRGKSIRILLRKRISERLLAGLWEFPSVTLENDSGSDLIKKVLSTFKIKVKNKGLFTTVKHAYTHLRVTVSAYKCLYESGKFSNQFKWVSQGELSKYPMGKVNRLIANRMMLIPDER